jgi:uncharacterized protein YndB with AHSA1/START domain
MPRQHLQFEQFFAAPRQQVFAFFADHERFGRAWWPARCRCLKTAAGDDANGLGSVREIAIAGVRFQETITAYQPSDLIEYRVTQGGPFKNHLGRMRFSDVPGGTLLHYTIEFDSRWPLAGNLVAGTLCATWHRGVPRVMDSLMAA